MRGAVYEQERLLLAMQERLFEAIGTSGLSMDSIGARAGYIRPSAFMNALRVGRALNLYSAARIAHAAGYRIVPMLEKLP